MFELMTGEYFEKTNYTLYCLLHHAQPNVNARDMLESFPVLGKYSLDLFEFFNCLLMVKDSTSPVPDIEFFVHHPFLTSFLTSDSHHVLKDTNNAASEAIIQDDFVLLSSF